LDTSIIPQVEEDLKVLALEVLQLVNEETHLPARHRKPKDPIRQLQHIEIHR
jgi:hypothetical protein